MSMLWCIAACSAGGIAGLCGALKCFEWRQRQHTKRQLFAAAGIPRGRLDLGLASDGLSSRIVHYCVELGNRISFGVLDPLCTRNARAFSLIGAWLASHDNTSGLGGLITREGFCEARIRLAFAGAAVGAICGAMLSNELAAAGFGAGCFLGFNAPRWALHQEERARCEELERELPQMLEVVALGLQSGLSFDRSLRLYHEHFSTPFAKGCASAQRQWELGLQTREEALRSLAASYASSTFSRIVETIVRALHFGSSLAGQLQEAATRARISHNAKREEQIAKAPVKMMIPTGTLILPAMLILVLGPVLLELMEGF